MKRLVATDRKIAAVRIDYKS